MITILPIIYGLAAGLSLYAALNHLLVGLRQRPRNQTHLAFSLMTFLVAGMIIADAGYRMSTTLERAALTLDIGISLTALALAVFLWFVANYTGFRPRRFLVIVSLILVLLSALNLLLPNGPDAGGPVPRALGRKGDRPRKLKKKVEKSGARFF